MLGAFEALVSGGRGALNITAIVGAVAVLVSTVAGGERDNENKNDPDKREPAWLPMRTQAWTRQPVIVQPSARVLRKKRRSSSSR